jgi:hypothetical protein
MLPTWLAYWLVRSPLYVVRSLEYEIPVLVSKYVSPHRYLLNTGRSSALTGWLAACNQVLVINEMTNQNDDGDANLQLQWKQNVLTFVPYADVQYSQDAFVCASILEFRLPIRIGIPSVVIQYRSEPIMSSDWSPKHLKKLLCS